MKYLLLLATLCGLAGCAAERDRVIYQKRAGTTNYCHTKVETSARDPIRPGERQVVDYYGPCDAFD
jgi:hypothetical protein